MKWWCILWVLLSPVTSWADSCQGRLINPVTDICWSCMLPISLGSAALTKSKLADTANTQSPFCVCPYKHLPIPGLALGYWEPIALVDVTRAPYCLVALGGKQLPIKGAAHGYRAGTTVHHSFYQVHWYRFPILFLLGLITDEQCASAGEWSMAFFSELMPTWQDDDLAFLVNPDSAKFSSVLAQLMCAEDALQSSHKLPNDQLFWCAGAQGSVFPLTGYVQSHVSGVQASMLLVQRTLLLLHRLKLLKDSRASSGPSLCTMHTAMTLPKQRYRVQITYPKAGRQPKQGATAIGAKTSDWNQGYEYPYQGEDFSYLIFRKRNCCAL